MKLQVTIEKNENDLWGRIEGKGKFMPVTVGNTAGDVLDNLKKLIVDYMKHEGKQDSME